MARALRIALAAALVMLAGPALAAAPSAAPSGGVEMARGQVAFHVTMVQAKKKNGGVDPSLRGLKRYLEESFPGYQSFKNLGQDSERREQGDAFTMSMPDGQTLSLTWLGSEGGFIKVRLMLDGLKTTIRVKDGGLFFQAGRPLRAGGMLVLAISAKSR